jgi:hypothetical protein
MYLRLNMVVFLWLFNFGYLSIGCLFLIEELNLLTLQKMIFKKCIATARKFQFFRLSESADPNPMLPHIFLTSLFNIHIESKG